MNVDTTKNATMATINEDASEEFEGAKKFLKMWM
jgi:hypothetical protein